MIWNWERYALSFTIIVIVLLFDRYAFVHFKSTWKNKYYDIFIIGLVLFLAQNALMIDTLVTLVKHIMGR